MKKWFILCFCFLVVQFSYAQVLRPVAERVSKYHGAAGSFANYSLFEETTYTAAGDVTYKNIVSQYTLARLDMGQLGKLLKNKPQTFAFSFPYGPQTLTVELYRVQVAADGFRVNTDKGPVDGYEPGLFYRGIIRNNPGSLVAFSFFADEIIGIASCPAFGNINLGRLREPGNHTRYIVYSDRYLSAPRAFSCSGAESPVPPSVGGGTYSEKELTVHCVRFYYEVSHDVYVQQGSSSTQTANWMMAIHNNVAAIYANDGINVALSEIFVWSSPSPFVSLETFSAYRRAFNGDVAVGVGFGGLAWLSTLCVANNVDEGISTGPYCVTYGDTVMETVPVFSQNVYVNTHETGHVLGSQHTHECVWNGNNTQIDDCGNMLPPPYPPGQEPGACFDSQNPIILANGTIMSYCGLADFSQGFGPQPAQRIKDRVENAPCLGGDCITSCVSSIDSIAITGVYATAATLTIYDSNPLVHAWEVRAYYTDPWTPISTSTYVVPLQPNSQFNIEVREVCPNGFSANFVTSTYVETPPNFCGQSIFDDGGASFPYSRYYFSRSYFPDAPYKHVTFTFSQFDVNPADTIRVYNGPDTNATYVSYTGSALPPQVSSTHPSGALTLALIPSTGFNTNAGWEITVGCLANPTTAAFSVSDTQICQGQQVTYTDQSTNNPDSWHWTFPGGSPDTSSAQNPTVTYNSAGTYNVTLIAGNAGGTDSETQNAYITVNAPPPAPVVTNNSGIFQSSYATGNQWYGSGGLIPGATGQTYTPTVNGSYYAIYTDANGCVSAAGNPVWLTASVEEWLFGADLKIFPNPIGDQFNVSWSALQTVVTDIRLYDVAGRVVYASGIPVESSVTIHTQHLSSGSYILELVTPKGSVRKPLVK